MRVKVPLPDSPRLCSYIASTLPCGSRGGHKLVARGHVLVGHRLGDALAHGVVVEVEVGLLTARGADHVGDFACHRPSVT